MEIFEEDKDSSIGNTTTPISDGTQESLDASEKVFPTENILKTHSKDVIGDRYKTNVWVSRAIFSDFKDACHISGRKTCDILEPMMKAFVDIVRKGVLEGVTSCPFKALEIKIGTLRIDQKYAKRGPKKNNDSFCPYPGYQFGMCQPVDKRTAIGCTEWDLCKFKLDR